MSSKDSGDRPSIPTESAGSNVRGPEYICPLAKPDIEVVWGDVPTGVAGITVTLTAAVGVGTCTFNATDGSGRAPWRVGAGVTEGQYTVALAGMDPDIYEQTTTVMTLGESFAGRKTIVLKKFARPEIEVGWGPSLARKAGGVRVNLNKGLVNVVLGPTVAVHGTATLGTPRGLDPGQYTLSLPDADDRRVYRLETTNVTLTEGQGRDPAVKVQLKKLARPKIRVVDNATGKGVGNIPVKLVAGASPPASPPREEYSLGETRLSGTAELAPTADGIPPGQYTIEFGAGRYEPTLVSPAVVAFAEGSTETIQARVTLAKGMLVVEVNRNDGEVVRPIGPAASIGLTVKLSGTLLTPAADKVATAKTATVVKEAGRTVTVQKAVCELATLAPGDYDVALKDLTNLRHAQDPAASPPASPPATPVWSVGPNAAGTVTVRVEAGKTTTVNFTLSRYKKVQFVGFDIYPGTKAGFRCVTCGSFSTAGGPCTTLLHGNRHSHACFRCTPPTGANGAGPCPINHPEFVGYACDACLQVGTVQGNCTNAGCLGRCWPYCGSCGSWFGDTICIPCGGAGATRAIALDVAGFQAGQCPHGVAVNFPAPMVTCHTCVAQYKEVFAYLGLDNSEDDLGARCLIMKEGIKKAYSQGSIDKTPAGDEILKIFMAPEFYFRNTAGGYPVELISSILEQMRDETMDAKYKDWLFVYGSAIGYLKHESWSPPSAAAELPLRITNVIPGPTIKLHVARRLAGWADANVCERIPTNNRTLAALCQWKVKQGVGIGTVVSARSRVTTTVSCAVTCPRHTDPAAEEYEIEVAGGVWIAGDCELVEPKATEVFNVVLIQKGGADAGVGTLRELLVYKEYVSPIDFLSAYSREGWHTASGEGRVTLLHHEFPLTLPTAGSRDLLGVSPNPGDERTIHGLGGGSVFTSDGITFGLEVCLDHAKNKLYDFYAAGPGPGTPRVQVHLIPSWGMSIDQGHRCGVTNALIFNVDGPNGSAAAQLTAPTTVHTDRKIGVVNDLPAPTDVALDPLPTAPWDIKVVDPASLNRTSASPPPSPPGPFALIPRQIPADTMGTFFEKKVPAGSTLAAFGNIKIYAAADLPPAETI